MEQENSSTQVDSERDTPAAQQTQAGKQPRRGSAVYAAVLILLAIGIGLSVAYLRWGEHLAVASAMPSAQPKLSASKVETVPELATSLETEGSTRTLPDAKPTLGAALPPAQYVAELPESYTLPVRYGDLGPQLIAAGVIDLPAFVAIYTDGGAPLSAEQKAILTTGSDAPVVIDAPSSHFLLNFFWAVGLANRNPILLEGPIQDKGAETVGQYSSTGGWTLASRPVMDIFASLPLIELTAEQQQRVQTVAEGVYRPCCGNNTAFPDCNHGMAMLGILELMAANDASEDEMFAAAKYVNAFWFPKEMTEAAAYFKLTLGQGFAAVDPRRMVSREIFSMSGAQSVRQWLQDGGRLGAPVEGGGSCGV